MHLIVAYAGTPAKAHPQAPVMADDAQSIDWAAIAPQLARIASTWTTTQAWTMPPTSYSVPHEVAWGKAVGACTDDGRVPWAAMLAAQDGVALTDPCALLSFMHWRVTPSGLLGEHPDALGLNEQESAALAQAVEPWIREAGFAVHRGLHGRLYVSHPDLGSLRTASLAHACLAL
jgi:hypothetical protein